MGSAHTITIDEQIYLEDVLNTALTSLCFNDEALFFLVKSRLPVLGSTLLKCRIIRISKLHDNCEQNFAVLYKSELHNIDMCDMIKKKRLYIIYKVCNGVKSTTCF